MTVTKSSSGGRLSFRGLALEGVPTWTLATITILGALAVIAGLYWWLFANPQRDLVTQRQANAVLRETMAEYAKHVGESPESSVVLLNDVRGKLDTSRYADNCLVVSFTPVGGARRSKLIVDLGRDPDTPRAARLLDAIERTVLAAPATNCDGRVHLGPFREEDAGREGCFAFVRRVFADGCVHVQPFDVCHGVWLDPKWIVCRH